jgi:predicted nucleic-acid-binding Zn-ribbon protein
MMETGKCAKCGTAEIVPDARLHDSRGVVAQTDAHPGAMIFKETESCELYARVCSQCGFTELYVREPHKLYQAHLKAEAERENPTG